MFVDRSHLRDALFVRGVGDHPRDARLWRARLDAVGVGAVTARDAQLMKVSRCARLNRGMVGASRQVLDRLASADLHHGRRTRDELGSLAHGACVDEHRVCLHVDDVLSIGPRHVKTVDVDQDVPIRLRPEATRWWVSAEENGGEQAIVDLGWRRFTSVLRDTPMGPRPVLGNRAVVVLDERARPHPPQVNGR